MVNGLAEMLVVYPKEKFDYIIDGFTNGLRISFATVVLRYVSIQDMLSSI